MSEYTMKSHMQYSNDLMLRRKCIVRWDSKAGASMPDGLVKDAVADFVQHGGDWTIGQSLIVVALQHAVFKKMISPDDIVFIEHDHPVSIDTDGMFLQCFPIDNGDLACSMLLDML